jgi:hypothetical protein
MAYYGIWTEVLKQVRRRKNMEVDEDPSHLTNAAVKKKANIRYRSSLPNIIRYSIPCA